MMSMQSSEALPLSPIPRQILELSALAAGEKDLELLFDAATKTIVAGLEVDDCHIYRCSAAAGALRLVAAFRTLERHSSNTGNIPLTTPFISHDNFMRELSVVIEGDTAPFGVLAIINDTPRTFSSVDVEFATCVASILTESLRKAHSIRDRARLASVVAATNEAVVGFTNDGRIFSWNQAAEVLFGYSSAEAIGQPLTILFPAGLMPFSIFDLMERTIVGSIGTILRQSDEAQIEAEVRVTPIVGPEGQIAAGSMIARDVREKRRADRALQMHADILAHMPAAVVVWCLENRNDAASLRLVLANSAADHVAGCVLDDRAGARFAEVMLGDGHQFDPEPYAAVVRSSVPRDFGEIWLDQADGSRRAYHVQAFPLPDDCVGVVLNDVTERRELADRLQHAQRLEVIGRMAAGIAHDFNNLLTVISGYSELLQPVVAANDRAVADLHEIERASQSAQQLTRQLLAFGRRQILQPATLDLSSMVRSAQGMLRRLIGEDIQLIVPDQDPVAIHADAGQIEQVLLNLAINARDAMPAGGKLFIESSLQHVSAEAAACHTGVPAGVYGMLQITDTGIGMDQRTLARVFEPFFTTKGVGHGTGLGLSTVYGIVKQSAGHIMVDSEPGVGTTFRVYLPATSSREEIVVQEEQPHERIAALPPTGTHTVLLVEDDDTVRCLLQKVLAGAGYTVLVSATPQDALQLAGRFTGSIDLLLTDIVMPVQSGPELAARLTVSFPALQVLYMSGYLPEVSGHRTIPTGARFIHKPFSPDDLLDAVQRALYANGGCATTPAFQVVM